MRGRRFGSTALIVVLLIGGLAYLASPFVAVWSLRHAIRVGDTATIERKVVWSSVRESLKSSIAQHQQWMPEVDEMGTQVEPTMWQRVKAAFGATMLDRFIETYVTPEGLPKLFRYKKTWSVDIKGEQDEEKLDLAERFKRFYHRIVRAEFVSPTKVEVEIVDSKHPDRHYVSVMELIGYEWKLSALRVVAAKATGATAASAKSTQ